MATPPRSDRNVALHTPPCPFVSRHVVSTARYGGMRRGKRWRRERLGKTQSLYNKAKTANGDESNEHGKGDTPQYLCVTKT